MNTLENIENLVDSLAAKAEAIMDDRGRMLAEVSGLREKLAERDKEAVKATQDMRAELEATNIDTLRFEQQWVRVETKMKNLNDRLITLACGEEPCED
jgi:hypothetical protein